MADLKYYDIIDKPVITEKSMSGMEDIQPNIRNTHFMCTQRQQKIRSGKR